MTNEEAYIKAHERLRRFIETNRLRNSIDRDYILRTLFMHGEPTTVDALHERLLADYSEIHTSRATVYNNLELFCAIGFVVKHNFGDQTFYYEPIINEVYHIFMRCTRCNQVITIRDKRIREALLTKHYTAFTPSAFDVLVSGLCRDCQRRERQAEATLRQQQKKVANRP